MTRSVPLMMNVPVLGHHREIAHEDRLLADLTRLRVDEADAHRAGPDRSVSFSRHSLMENWGSPNQ